MQISTEMAGKGDPTDEFIIRIDFNYCDVTYSGYEVMTRAKISKLLKQLDSDRKIGTPNMPGHWYEEFDISRLQGAFTIHSQRAEDIEAMRSLFGDAVGNTELIDCVLDNADENEESSYEEDGEVAFVDHITLEVAEQFLKNADSANLSEATSMDDDAAEVLSNHNGVLSLLSLSSLSEATAESLAKHEGLLELSAHEYSDAIVSYIARHQGFLCLSGIESLSDAAAEILSGRKGALYLNVDHLSDSAAEALSKHEGELGLEVYEISDTGLEYVSKHVGRISMQNPAYCQDLDEWRATCVDAAEWVKSMRKAQV